MTQRCDKLFNLIHLHKICYQVHTLLNDAFCLTIGKCFLRLFYGAMRTLQSMSSCRWNGVTRFNECALPLC